MGDLSIKNQEIEKLKSQLNNIQEKKLKIDHFDLTKLHKTHRLTQRIKTLENECAISQTIAQAKENN